MKTNKLRNYFYFLSLVPSLCTIFGNINLGNWVFLNVFFSLVILIPLELILGDNISKEDGEQNDIPQLIILLHVFLQIVALGAAFWSIANFNLSTLEFIGIIISTGLTTGSSATIVAHELVHRRSKWELNLGKFLLLSSYNVYFYIEHIFVHHKYVGTAKDPATARYGENVYVFAIRSFYQQIVSAFELEGKNLNKKKLNKWHYKNEVVANALILLCFTAILLYINKNLALFFILQGLIGCFLLEYINYIEHYGLSRDEKERVTESHSWNSDKVVSRYMLVDLSRHADHHYYAHKKYNTLTTYNESPTLPSGYLGCLPLAFIPPLWYSVMHKKIAEIQLKNEKIQ